eukprot:258333-Prorocentrum_minimum.AAC.2
MSLDSARLITGPGCGGRAAIPLGRTLVRESYLYVTPPAGTTARTGYVYVTRLRVNVTPGAV